MINEYTDLIERGARTLPGGAIDVSEHGYLLRQGRNELDMSITDLARVHIANERILASKRPDGPGKDARLRQIDAAEKELNAEAN